MRCVRVAARVKRLPGNIVMWLHSLGQIQSQILENQSNMVRQYLRRLIDIGEDEAVLAKKVDESRNTPTRFIDHAKGVFLEQGLRCSSDLQPCSDIGPHLLLIQRLRPAP